MDVASAPKKPKADQLITLRTELIRAVFDLGVRITADNLEEFDILTEGISYAVKNLNELAKAQPLLAARAQPQFANTPVVMLSGPTSGMDPALFIGLTVNSFLRKSPDVVVLGATLQPLLP